MITLDKEILSTARVIARGRAIKDLERLLSTYGGVPRGWTKRSSRALMDSYGHYELHWYEHAGLGRFEIKRIDFSRD